MISHEEWAVEERRRLRNRVEGLEQQRAELERLAAGLCLLFQDAVLWAAELDRELEQAHEDWLARYLYVVNR